MALLRELGEEVLGRFDLLLASNRGPVTYHRRPEGHIYGERGAGGVVTAMSGVTQVSDVVWVASAMTEADREMAQRSAEGLIDWPMGPNRFRLRFVVSDPESYDGYYNIIANPLLWFLQHYMWDAPRSPTITEDHWRAWHEGYVEVNRNFAQAIAERMTLMERRPLVMLQDYHLYLCASFLREHAGEEAILHHFTHIPWPGPDYWGLLPEEMRLPIIEGMVSHDIVGFQTEGYRLNFLRTCENFLPRARVSYRNRTVTYRGHTCRSGAYPISIDVAALEELAQSQEVGPYRHWIQARTGALTIIRVDRLEPSKNIVRGFQAFDLLLERYPEYRERLRFLAFLVPSRLEVEEYQRYLEEIYIMQGKINVRWGSGDWTPIQLFVGDNYPRAVAAMQLYDVLLVNPILDGMNLVSKEGPIVNTRDGVLVLSESAGSAEQLRKAALMVSPYDIVGTAEMLHRALQMAEAEKRRRAERLARAVREQDLFWWLARQFKDILELAG